MTLICRHVGFGEEKSISAALYRCVFLFSRMLCLNITLWSTEKVSSVQMLIMSLFMLLMPGGMDQISSIITSMQEKVSSWCKTGWSLPKHLNWGINFIKETCWICNNIDFSSKSSLNGKILLLPLLYPLTKYKV